jgi:hypothetical protein
MPRKEKELSFLIGRPFDSLSIDERKAAAGCFAALEIYTPQTLPLRRIEAIGASAGECIAQLRARGLDPTRFEFVRLTPAY